MQAIEDLKSRSAPERLPSVAGSLGDACKTLQTVLQSPEFRASVGDSFGDLPPLGAESGDGAISEGPQHRVEAGGGLLQLSDEGGATVTHSKSDTTERVSKHLQVYCENRSRGSS